MDRFLFAETRLPVIFSAATGYALRALASMPEDRRFHLTRHLAEELDLPGPYLAKVLKQLARAERRFPAGASLV